MFRLSTYFVFFILFLFCSSLFAQNDNCAGMEPICTDNGLSFTANGGGTDAMVTEPGNDYSCLGSAPNPAWYFLEIDNGGTLNMTLSAGSDVDFALWGPFPNLANAQGNCGSLGSAIDCSFDAASVENVNINGAVSGEVYILLITNFSGVVQPVTLTLDGSSTGDTDCTILTP